jgi:uncharacterized protein YkwD
MMARHGRARRFAPALLPRRKRERRRIEYLGGAAISFLGILIVSAFLLSGSQRFFLSSPQVAAVVSAVLVDLANTDRTSNDVAALTTNPVLVAAAQAKANDMAEKGYFAHVSPEGVDPWQWFKQAGYSFQYAGENLAVDFSDSGDVNSAWMNSPEHRANLLDQHYTEIGIATAQGMYEGHPTTFVVEEFGAPAGASSQTKVTGTIPVNPSEIATARSTSGAILGQQTQKVASAKQVPLPIQKSAPKAIATTAPATAASLAKETTGNVPAWGYIVGFPRESLRYAYYILGFLILLAFGIDTGFEIHRRHARRAVFAGGLLMVMCALFVLANFAFFTQPVLAAVAASL